VTQGRCALWIATILPKTREERKMLTEADRHRAAEEILRAERERRAIPQLSETFPKMEIEDAYRVQKTLG
jgi:hypothetical protein